RKLATSATSTTSSASGRADSAAAAAAMLQTTLRVALLYKRNWQPDEELLKLLETELEAQGYPVFIDRHLTIGEERVKPIEPEIRTADAIIPLLSAGSVHSEVLTYELQTAHAAAQQQGGKPRLLPVRVNYTGPLPDALAPILGPLHYTLWESSKDNERLVAEV